MAAIIRQYFREGWYPSGNKQANDSFLASSALLKAMLINSAQALTGLSTTGSSTLASKDEITTLSSVPSYYQGWGRPQLDEILSIGVAANVFGLYVDDGSVAVQNVTNRLCIEVYSNLQPLKVTVVWTDPPASPAAGGILVSNIDLIMAAVGSYEYRSNFAEDLDSVNNVEQLVLEGIDLAPGYYSVLVHGTYLPQGDQPYAIVITGDFNITSDSCTLDCPFNCGGSSNGQCINGLCLCEGGYYGPDCSLSWCPNACSGNGVCTKEGVCMCHLDWEGADCSSLAASDSSDEETIDLSIFIGVTIAIFFVGILFAFPLGAYVALHRLRKKAIKKKRETMLLLQPSSPINTDNSNISRASISSVSL